MPRASRIIKLIEQGFGFDYKPCPKCDGSMVKVIGLKTTGKPLWECPSCGYSVREGWSDVSVEGGKTPRSDDYRKVEQAEAQYPKIVKYGLDRFRPGGDKDLNWVWFHVASPQDKKEFEKYLVDTKHPLAYQPGSPEYRYKAFMYDLIKKL